MDRFRVFVRGIMSPVVTPDGECERWFYTARDVKAPSASAARLEAIRSVQGDPKVAGIMQEWQCGPLDILVDEVIQLALTDEFKEGTQEFIFFDERDPDAGAV